MEMVKHVALSAGVLLLMAGNAAAGEFSLAIGSTIAAAAPAASGPSGQTRPKVKMAGLFAVRMEECGLTETAQIKGSMEGIVDGARISSPVSLTATGQPGVYVVGQESVARAGIWVVSLRAACGNQRVGAIVPIGLPGSPHEGLKLLKHPPTDAEVDASLKTLERTGR